MRMLPIVDRLETQYADKMAFESFVVDEFGRGQEIQSRLDIGGHPSFVILRSDGSEVQRHWGTMGEAALETSIQTALAG